MWLQDLDKALTRLKEECDYNFICVENITPAADGGIVFKTTYHTYIKWFPNGEIVEKKEGEMEKMIKCPNCGSTAQVQITSTVRAPKDSWFAFCNCWCGYKWREEGRGQAPLCTK